MSSERKNVNYDFSVKREIYGFLELLDFFPQLKCEFLPLNLSQKNCDITKLLTKDVFHLSNLNNSETFTINTSFSKHSSIQFSISNRMLVSKFQYDVIATSYEISKIQEEPMKTLFYQISYNL